MSQKQPPEQDRNSYSVWNVWKRVASLGLPDALYFALALTAYALEAICSSLQPIYLGKAFDLVSIKVARGMSNAEESINEMVSIFQCIALIELLRSAASYGTSRAGSNFGDFVRQRAQA